MPDSFAQHADGLLLIANGIDPVLRWDGLAAQAETAGVIAPTSALTMAIADAGNISGTYYAYSRFVDRYGNVSNLSPLSNSVTVTNKKTITYTGVPVPQEAKVTKRQILRNTAGQAAVFYVDVETTDLTSTSFTSTQTDAILQVQTAVVLLDTDGTPLANLHAPPPDDRAVVAAQLDRVFLAGEEIYSLGCVSVVAASATVTGIGTEWRSTFTGRFLWVDGADKPYEILSVSESAQTLTLLEAYAGPTNPYASYAVRPALPLRRAVYFSEAGQPESWAATNAISVQEDSDEITALMPKGSFLYILCRRHNYRLTFQENPIRDGFVFFVNARGCINKHCWALVDDMAYLLDETGCYSFDGGQEIEEISAPIQDIFEGGRDRLRPYKIHWPASRWFHCVYDPGQKVVRWFVSLAGQEIPRHAIAFELSRKGWWIEEFPFPVGASCVFHLDGEPKVALGGPGGAVYVMNQGNLDLADSQQGTVRGTVSSALPLSLTDLLAGFATDLSRSTVAIVSGKGKGQARRIVSNTYTVIHIDVPWTSIPDATSVYQVGGVAWKYRTGVFRFANDETDNPRRLEVVFEPAVQACSLDARVYYDRSRTPVTWDYSYSTTDSMGFSSAEGDGDLQADLAKPIGFVQRRLDWRREYYVDGPRFVQVEFVGVSNDDQVILYEVTIDGAVS